MEEQLTTRQIAEALQVSESSVKRWCDRGVIPTIRTAGGHRRIPLGGLIRYLEESDQQVPAILSSLVHPVPPPTREDAQCNVDALRTRLREALDAGDAERCRQTLLDAFAEGSIASLADALVAPTFHEIGDRWDCGELEVYQERRSCEICSRALQELWRRLPEPPPNAPLAIGGSPAGDHYSLPGQLIELVLRQGGWKSMNMGSNLPLASLAAAAVTHRPKLLWLSVSHIEGEAQFLADYGKFYAELPPSVAVVLGGRALNDRLRPKLRYSGFCDNMEQLASLAIAIHSRRSPIAASDN